MRPQEEALRQNLSARKSGMSKKQRAKLRKQALEEIRATEGIREDFITEVLVEAKENEILKREVDE